MPVVLASVDERTGLPIVGMVGAGQLARMCHAAAIPLGMTVAVLAADAEDGAAVVTPAVQVGDYRNLDDLRRFADGCDVVTWDHEHVPGEHITALAEAGVDVQPTAAALVFAQDKAVMRRRLGSMGIPCPRWVDLEDVADPRATLDDFGAEVGWPLVLKASRHGYDGKGVWMVDSPADAEDVLASGTPLIVEEKVPLARELAADVARRPSGDLVAWPVVETVQSNGICVQVIAPAQGLSSPLQAEAADIATRIADELGVTGVLAVELFQTTDGRLLVNELAMRPHNSGHWTIEGSRTSQFEQHLRAVLDKPLGAATTTAPVTVMANVLGGADPVPAGLDDRVRLVMERFPDVKIHLYGKTWRPGRKVGHVTALGDDFETVHARAVAGADLLANGEGATT